MADVVVFGEKTEYLKSVNTPDYESNPNAVVNPDLSAVAGVNRKYWKLSKGAVAEMTTEEKAVVDAAEVAARKSVADSLDVGMRVALTALVKVINLRLPTNQKIAQSELIIALKQEI